MLADVAGKSLRYLAVRRRVVTILIRFVEQPILIGLSLLAGGAVLTVDLQAQGLKEFPDAAGGGLVLLAKLVESAASA